MKYFYLLACVSALGHSVIAFLQGDFGYGLGLFGGFGAWTLITARTWGLDL